ncbi:MAG TPA: proton-conducting membrane transporter, partial [Pseudorhodoplanes sp.]|nr:proton-conducting membrane transporter [Pseudorhodoplanes sp.]
FIRAIFLGARKPVAREFADAPFFVLLPQYLLVAGILVMSFFPKLLIESISAAIDPQFASTLRWQGMSLELIYATWNPLPVMAFAVAIAAILFALLWFARRTLPLGGASRTVYSYAQAVGAALTPPLATRFYSELTAMTVFAAERARRIYTGNGLTYNLCIVYYFLALYALGGGAAHVWALTRPA